jgi:flagellar FliL protein
MAEEELKLEEGGKKNKLIIIAAVVIVILIAVGGASYFFLMGNDDAPDPSASETMPEGEESGAFFSKAGNALYVAMPRPFVFNVPGVGRDRLVEIKVQLMLRGSDNEEQAKMHIPLIEGTLLKAFSNANADALATEAGKKAIRNSALKELQKTMRNISGDKTVEEILFTGFVMQ